MSLLGVDVGTSGCKAVAFTPDGQALASAYREYPTHRPRPGWAELDGPTVWAAVLEVIRATATGAEQAGDPVRALCAGSMGEAVALVTRDRRVFGPSVLSSDERGSAYVETLKARYPQERFYRINPNILGVHYTLPKLLWLREHEPALFHQADRFLLWGDAVLYLLGAEAVASYSLANRTLLFDLWREDWSDELLAFASLSRESFGVCVPAGRIVGETSGEAARHCGLRPGVRLVSGGHDQCCNALGAGLVRPGQAVCGIGSFECLTPVYAAPPEPARLLRHGLNIEHHVLPGLYVSFLYNQGGTLVTWFRDVFAAAEKETDAHLYDRLNQEMPEAPTRLLVLPHFERTGPPHFIGDSAGVIAGLRTATTRGEIFKALLEGETFYFVESLAALREMGMDTSRFVATGGGARSDRWLQIKADIWGVPIARPRVTEAGVLGAAILAGMAVGDFASAEEAVTRCVTIERLFEPDPTRHAFYQERAALFRSLYPSLAPLLKQL